MKTRAEITKSWREKHRKMGLCVGCTRKASKNFALCKICRESRLRFQKQRIASGMCFRCSNRAATGRTKCLNCVLKVALYQLKKRGLPQSELDKAMVNFLVFVYTDSKCVSCGCLVPVGGERFDHDDKLKKFRGIICHGCNVAIGFAGEDVQRLRGCVAYLEKQR